MSRTALIIFVVIFTLILVGVLVYGLVFKPKSTEKMNPATTPNNTTTNNNTTNTGNNGGGTTNNNNSCTNCGGNNPTPTPAPSVPQNIKDLAKKFRERFLGGAATRCGIIGEVNLLNDADLKKFHDFYRATYSLTPKQEMDGAWVWCATNSVDTTLYNRLSKQ